jgi:3'(2'), 5'-bisphosphate nucleotidase
MRTSMGLLEEVEAIARGAGAEIMRVYARDFSATQKEDKSPLTEADTAAHEHIILRLGKLQPALPILSEEAVGDFSSADDSGRYWLVDPLDGTREFIKRNGEFTVNIALIEHGRAILGVVYAPALDVAYLAAEGLGAFKTGKERQRTPIRVAEHEDGSPWRVVGSRSHAGDSLTEFLNCLDAHELMPMGSSLKFCLVAEGSADVYPRMGPTSLWDTAAAQCVVEQAGGRVIQLTGEPISYADSSVVLNPFFLVHGRSAVNWADLFRGSMRQTASEHTVAQSRLH